jgi:hypothetical protein
LEEDRETASQITWEREGPLLVLRRLLDVPRDPFLPSSAGSVSPLLRLLL